MTTHHTLHASPETVHWGYLDAQLAPVLTIRSGDRVTVEMSTYDLDKGRLIFRQKGAAPAGPSRSQAVIASIVVVGAQSSSTADRNEDTSKPGTSAAARPKAAPFTTR